MSPTPRKPKRPKPRIPLPQKPPKAEPGKDVYRRKPKHPKEPGLNHPE